MAMPHSRTHPHGAGPPLAERSIWTVDELERLPEHGNRYEILHGELLVTTRDAVTWTPDAALPWMVITADELFGPAPATG